MQQYIDNQQTYICKTRSYIAKVKISDIYYLEIIRHNITVHASHSTYEKYETLTKGLDTLFPYGFIKCNQSYIASLSKIRDIHNNDLILIDDTVLRISRGYAPKLLSAFNACNALHTNKSRKITCV